MNCLGALDGTYVPVTMSAEERPRYRNRALHLMLIYCKMLYVGTIDFMLQEISTILWMRVILMAYRGTKYHLSEWSGNNRPENYKELFNLRQSIARNVVERGFGLLKKRWTPMDHDISNHSTLEGNNAQDRIASVQVTDQWTNFRDTLAVEMFHNYQVQ
ncbi:unnamed protein product [Prunus armeniaca]